MSTDLALAASPAFDWVRAHPFATFALCACVLVVLARAYFNYTRHYLERFEELPDPRSLSMTELAVLANPRRLDPDVLERLGLRWRTAGRVATLLAIGVVGFVGVSAVMGAEPPRAEALARLANLRSELASELDRDEQRAPDLGGVTYARRAAERDPRVSELAARLEAQLATLSARADRARFELDEQRSVELAMASLARAQGRYATLLELVPEAQLERLAAETDQRVECEVALLAERARALRGLGDSRRAVPLFERALELRPGRVILTLELAEGYLHADRYQEAAERLQECAPLLERAVLEEGRIELAARLVRARGLLGRAHVELDQLEAAALEYGAALSLLCRAELFEASARLDDDLARTLRARAEVSWRMGERESAREDLTRALALRRARLADPPTPERSERLAGLLFELARTRRPGDGPQLKRALAELEEAGEWAVGSRSELSLLENGLALTFGIELGLERARVLFALGRVDESHTVLDEQIELLDALPPNPRDPELARARAALFHAEIGLALDQPELALEDLMLAGELLELEAARGTHAERLERLIAAGSELRGRALAMQAPPLEVLVEGDVKAASDLPAPEAEPLPAEVESVGVPPSTALEPNPLESIERRLRAWELKLGSEEDPRLLAAPAPDLLARAELHARADRLGPAIADADRAVALLRAGAEAESEAGSTCEPALLELGRALGARGSLRAREGRFLLAHRDYDERVRLLGGRDSLPTGPAEARELAEALRARALVAFNRREPAAALADLDAALGLFEGYAGGLSGDLAGLALERLDAMRRERERVAAVLPGEGD